jgi:hypothetical protein
MTIPTTASDALSEATPNSMLGVRTFARADDSDKSGKQNSDTRQCRCAGREAVHEISSVPPRAGKKIVAVAHRLNEYKRAYSKSEMMPAKTSCAVLKYGPGAVVAKFG